MSIAVLKVKKLQRKTITEKPGDGQYRRNVTYPFMPGGQYCRIGNYPR
jgi:hypothetical protein